MLKLEATLIARKPALPWRNGWSLERGIDFIVWAPTRKVIIAPVETGRIVASEPVSFLDADDIMPAGSTGLRRYPGLAAQEAAAGDGKDTPLTRAWSSVARKVPGS